LASVAIVLAGCAAPSKPAAPAPTRAATVKPPIRYEPLGVRNSCFVESVHLYDTYLSENASKEETPWARVLQWGNREGEFNISAGHAITVFVVGAQLWSYDINFGFLPLNVPVDRRADITDVSPKVFSRYPQFRPILARYRDDFPQRAPSRRPDFLFYHRNRDVRDATRVASELSRVRPVRVFEFEYKEKGQNQSSAGAAFYFGSRLCLYFPRQGTYVSRAGLADIEDLRFIRAAVKHMYPNLKDVRWQSGGYLFLPPKEKKS
jgi:hypothetical protein